MCESLRPDRERVYILMTECLKNDKRILFVPQFVVSKSKLTVTDKMNTSYHGYIHTLVTDKSKHHIIDYKEYRHGEAACIDYHDEGDNYRYTIRYNIIECDVI